MVLDRALTVELLDVALRIASGGEPWTDQRRLLTVALRDRVSAQEAEGKTKKCLTRVWINPPEPAADMIEWAREHANEVRDRRILHLGALIATFPFAGSVCADIGRSLALNGVADTADIRRKAKARWGDRESIAVGARKVYTTLRTFGVLKGGGAKAPLRAGETLNTDENNVAWIAHALLLTRGAESIAESDLAHAPELFWVTCPAINLDAYPLLEKHIEGGRRSVVALALPRPAVVEDVRAEVDEAAAAV